MTEYIGLAPSQKSYAKKNLLYCEMDLLNTIKRHKRYKKLRKQIEALRSLLKRTVAETQNEIKKLEHNLPKTRYDKFRAADISTTKKTRSTLESEIDEIRKKISELS